MRKVAGNSHLSPPLLDANHKRLNRLFVYQRNNAEHLDCSSSCHSSFQNIDYNGSQLSKPGVKKKTKMKPKPSSSGTAISLSRKTGTTPKPISESMPNLVPSNSGLKWSDVVATKSHPSSPHDGKETSHSKSNRNSQVDWK